MIRLALLLIPLLLSARAAADPVTLHVDAVHGSDAGDGSEGAPLATIGAALALAASGDSIAVAAGSYAETVTMKDGVDLASSGAELSGMVHCAGAALRGFVITAGIDCGAPAQIERNVIHARVEVAETSGVAVSGNVFLALGDGAAGSSSTDGAVHVVSASDVRITDNTFFDSFGVQLAADAAALIANNALVHGLRGVELAMGATAEIRNNDVYDNHFGIIGFASDYVGLDNQTGVAGNVSVAPSFVDPDGGDFRLRLVSPLIDVGSNPDVSLAADLDGSTRIVDGDGDSNAVVDIGAEEFDPAEVLPLDVVLDVIPGKFPNQIALKKLSSPSATKKKVEVAILSNLVFPAPEDVDVGTLRLGSQPPLKCRAKDGNRDKVADLICSFPLSSIELGSWPIETPPACVRGQTLLGRKLLGCDEVEIRP